MSSQPAWREIESDLLAGIADGTYPPGTYLPSISSLVDGYGVSMSTAQRAYNSLVGRGIVLAEHGRGYLVSDRPPLQRQVDELRRRVETIERRLDEPDHD